MNRRKFLVGGGIVGFVAAIAVAATGEDRKASGKVCVDGHDPHPSFDKYSALAIDNTDKSNGPTKYNLVPCRRCGIMLAMPNKSSGAGIYVMGSEARLWNIG